MEHEQNLDRLIDAAAEDLVRQEPSRALTTNVMERLVSHPRQAGRGRLLGAGLVTAGLVTAGVVAAIVLSGRPDREGLREPSDSVGNSPAAPVAALGGAPAPIAPAAVLSPPRAVVTRISAVPDPTEGSIDPIAIDPVADRALETPAAIEIEPLSIPPLSATND